MIGGAIECHLDGLGFGVSTRLAMIRHGPTAWNLEQRVQGRSDIPLSDAGRAWVRTWRLPDEVAGLRWFVSPLRRARETAAILGLSPAIEESLVEIDWGEWDAALLPELREREAAAMAERRRQGAAFRAPGGESARDVQERLKPWLARIGAAGEPCGAVAHNGVIRALYALAADWDMTGPAPIPLRDASVHFFRVDRAGVPSVERMNVPLTDTPPPTAA